LAPRRPVPAWTLGGWHQHSHSASLRSHFHCERLPGQNVQAVPAYPPRAMPWAGPDPAGNRPPRSRWSRAGSAPVVGLAVKMRSPWVGHHPGQRHRDRSPAVTSSAVQDISLSDGGDRMQPPTAAGLVTAASRGESAARGPGGRAAGRRDGRAPLSPVPARRAGAVRPIRAPASPSWSRPFQLPAGRWPAPCPAWGPGR